MLAMTSQEQALIPEMTAWQDELAASQDRLASHFRRPELPFPGSLLVPVDRLDRG
jgi:hypothetical protein